jgi:replicative DNA helicase
MVDTDRGLPASPDAEKAILGAVILNNELAYQALTILRNEHFYLDAHRRIFRCIEEMSDTGKPIDTLTLTDELGRSRELESVGGVAYLSTLTERVPRRTAIDHYLKIVRDKAMLRSVIHAAAGMSAQALEETDTAEEVVSAAECSLSELRADRAQHAEAHISTFIMQAAERLHQPLERNLVGHTTGLSSLDRATTGIRNGELWIVGALPGRGKTAFGMQVAAANAQKGIPTLFFSLEMDRDQLSDRLLAAESGVEAKKIRKRILDANEKRLIREAADRMQSWSLYIDDSADLTDRELMARAKLGIRRYNVELIVVDYLRLVKCRGKELREQVGEAANTLRKLAKQEGVAVVALSQLRRPQNINDRPSMIDLKESGDVEAHAHTVILLYQPIDGEGSFTHADELIIGKQRNGPIGTELVRFDKNSLQFTERAHE